MDVQERLMALRDAGRVERCHTTPHIGSYTVGQHCYDVVNILLMLHPCPSLDLIKAALWHDVAERWIGDIPTPAKMASPGLEVIVRALERRCHEAVGVIVDLTASERRWLKAADRLELWLWAVEQVCMGNQNAVMIQRDLETDIEWMPIQCREFVYNYKWEPRSDQLP